MTEIVACYIVYNSAWCLERSIKSVEGLVDHFVFVDGFVPEIVQYRRCWLDGWANQESQSTDETKDICRCYGKFIDDERVWTTQVAKRNRYLAEVGLGDWAFVIDADESLQLDPPIDVCKLREAILDEVAPSIGLEILTYQDDKPFFQRGYFTTRFFKKTEGLHYCRNHSTIFGKNDIDVTSAACMLSNTFLVNDRRGRPVPYATEGVCR